MGMDPKKLLTETQKYFKITYWHDEPRLRYQPRSCEDCGIMAVDRRITYSRQADTAAGSWLRRCSECRLKTPVSNPIVDNINK